MCIGPLYIYICMLCIKCTYAMIDIVITEREKKMYIEVPFYMADKKFCSDTKIA